jgi:hypothetical protein
MKLFRRAADGGKNSGVTGFFLLEIKSMFSVVLLHFNEGSREAFHEHAFNAVTLWLKGRAREHLLQRDLSVITKEYTAGQIKFTARSTFHKVEALESTWALSVRGPWVDRWREWRKGKFVTLTHGRKEITT